MTHDFLSVYHAGRDEEFVIVLFCGLNKDSVIRQQHGIRVKVCTG